MANWFCADLHLGHEFVAISRGFCRTNLPEGVNLNEMAHKMGTQAFNALALTRAHDEHVIRAINARVGKADHLWVLGDVCKGTRCTAQHAAKMLDGLHVPPSHRHLVLGNHEKFHPLSGPMAPLRDCFGEVTLHGIIPAEPYTLVLSHMPPAQALDACEEPDPFRKWALPTPSGCVHLYGHIHASSPCELGCNRWVNVGMDAWHLAPVSQEQVLALVGA